MKKTYFAPELKVVKLNAQPLMVISGRDGDGNEIKFFDSKTGGYTNDDGEEL